MTFMQRRAVSVTLVLAGVALSACAQRGGGSSGGSIGHSGGFGSHSPAFRGSSISVGRPNFMITPQFRSARYTGPNSNQRLLARSIPAGYANRRSGNEREDRYRRPYRAFYGVGLPYGVGWIGPGYLGNSGYFGDSDPGFYGDSASVAPLSPDGPSPAEYNAPPPTQAAAAPPPVYRPTYQRPQSEPNLEPEAAVTLVFKDGRPAEQIHNYMLTRTTLYVQDQHLREIPINLLDLAATEKLNQDAGTSFELPGSSR